MARDATPAALSALLAVLFLPVTGWVEGPGWLPRTPLGAYVLTLSILACFFVAVVPARRSRLTAPANPATCPGATRSAASATTSGRAVASATTAGQP